MKNFLANTVDFCIRLKSKPGEAKTVKKNPPAGGMSGKQQAGSSRVYQSGKFDSKFAPYIAFVIAVFVSFIAAVTVASHDLPLVLGGL